MQQEWADQPHRRTNPLTGETILVSAHRTKRPWLGQVEKLPVAELPAHDPDCYLCPGGKRAGGETNPEFEGPFVFTNDFPALLPEETSIGVTKDELFHAEPTRGTARVICFSPRHDLTLPELPLDAIRKVVDTWVEQARELGKEYRWVQIFENKGEMMGCSNPHPHCQIWAGDALPTLPAKEDEHQADWYAKHGTVLLEQVRDRELELQERIVVENDNWLFLVPFWAAWPYEVLLLPKQRVRRFDDLDDAMRTTLADILKQMLAKYDNLFGISFPYSMGWHGAPYPVDSPSDHWLFHAHAYPPLLRSATVRKFMVGYEMLAESQRDLTPEQAAQRLREQPVTLNRTGHSDD
ncbi:UDP-glucose--hexose-1-phosphate uridylyltransferase [bacterium]|nr:UDP-glucose--hexose-1-phosphate uridylyltransferase [bacterium]